MIESSASAARDLGGILRELEPKLHPGVYVYSLVPSLADAANVQIVAAMVEDEGVTVVTSEAAAEAAGLPILFRAAWITLTVHSHLESVGLTAAFATALAEAGIGCNVVAGTYHDHLFVPVAQRCRAMTKLRSLQQYAGT